MSNICHSNRFTYEVSILHMQKRKINIYHPLCFYKPHKSSLGGHSGTHVVQVIWVEITRRAENWTITKAASAKQLAYHEHGKGGRLRTNIFTVTQWHSHYGSKPHNMGTTQLWEAQRPRIVYKLWQLSQINKT